MSFPDPTDGLSLPDFGWIPLTLLVAISYWAAEHAIYLGQLIIRVAYRWRAWAEKTRGHVKRP